MYQDGDMAVFPGSIPPAGSAVSTNTLAAAGHTALHNTSYDEIRALATKVGTGSSTPTSGTVLRGNGTGTSLWAQVGLTTDVTGTLPQANGGTGTTSATGSGAAVYQASPTISSPTLTAPTIANFSNAQHTHGDATNGGQLNGATAIQTATLKAAQMFNGFVKNRQGGTTGDASWVSAGTSNTDTSAKDVFIQVGTVQSSAGGAVTVTYPTAFTQAPVVFLMPISGGALFGEIDSAPTTTSFAFAVFNLGSTLQAVPTMWMAIGQ